MNGKEARALRILAEYLEPKSRLEAEGVEDTIVFFGSARIAEDSAWYAAARTLAFRLTQWSKGLDPVEQRRFVVCTGGGPGIMEAANRGAADARGRNVGLTISLPHEEAGNPHVTRELSFHFHYFFMRKLTLVQTKRMSKHMPIILFGTDYWKEVINFDALVRHGTINPEDVDLVHRTDSVDDAYEWLTRQLTEQAIGKPGAML